ncbi:MAG: hypothetical protein MJ009_02275 [Paludibacteraceae bacterium]|nr:hypothetical protein [Paludibacteraceae bacterium]
MAKSDIEKLALGSMNPDILSDLEKKQSTSGLLTQKPMKFNMPQEPNYLAAIYQKLDEIYKLLQNKN